jgi:hypothetical protein
MPDLTNEWWDAEIWDHDNLDKQRAIADKNVSHLLSLNMPIWEELLRNFQERYKQTKVSADLITWEINKTRFIFDLQRDLGALHYFITNWFQLAISELNFQDRNGIKGQIERIMNDAGFDPFFPQLVADAERAIKSDWAEPPATEMYVCEIASDVVKIQQIDWMISDPESIEFEIIVDTLREKVWDNLDLNFEIDEIINSNTTYSQKIIAFHESEILRPFIDQN